MTEAIPLERVLSEPASADQVVAIGRDGAVSRRGFEQRVSAWQALAGQVEGDTLGVYFEDALEFAAALFGLWYAGKTALLTGDRLPATVAGLRGRVAALAGDFPEDTGLPRLSRPESSPQPAGSFAPLDPHHCGVIVLTSGSTGDPKTVPATLAQLGGEVAMHEWQWGHQAGDSVVVGTVSHQHIYGLLWRVLWPLVGQRPFVREICHYAEDALGWAQQLDSVTLITTPSHLGRWPHQPGERAPGHWAQVVSSTAPLSREHSAFASDYFGTPVVEIFGSSETGGIAWRQQMLDDVWTTLEGISVSSDEQTGALLLDSPLVPGDDLFTTGDRAEVQSPRRFRLLGRLDRIAKIEGKRVSLTAMEARLEAHPRLDSARVVVLQGRRTETAVVAVPDEAGRQWLAQAGKRSVVRELRQWLSDHFEAPVLPRRWRLVDDLPRNAQGKVPQQSLLALFEPADSVPAKVTAAPRWPDVLEQEKPEPGQARLRIRLPADLVYFRGHFEELPVLPGVVQLHWAEHYARQFFGDDLPDRNTFARLEAVKFQEVIQPGREVSIELSWQAEKKRIQFRFHDGQTPFSSGRMVFDAEAS